MPNCSHCGAATDRKWTPYHTTGEQRWFCQREGCRKTFLDPTARKEGRLHRIQEQIEKTRPALLLLGLRFSSRQIETATGRSWDSVRRALRELLVRCDGSDRAFLQPIQDQLKTADSDHVNDLLGRLEEWIGGVFEPAQNGCRKGPLGTESRFTPARIRQLRRTVAGKRQVAGLLADAQRLTGLELVLNETGELLPRQGVSSKRGLEPIDDGGELDKGEEVEG